MENNNLNAIILMQSGAILRTGLTYAELKSRLANTQKNDWLEIMDGGQLKLIPLDRIELVAEQETEEKMV